MASVPDITSPTVAQMDQMRCVVTGERSTKVRLASTSPAASPVTNAGSTKTPARTSEATANRSALSRSRSQPAIPTPTPVIANTTENG